MKHHASALSALLLLLAVLPVTAQTVGGANAFLFRPAGIRAASLGGFTTSDAVDPSAVASNPAALGSIASPQVGASIALLPYEQHQNFAGVAVPVFKYLTLGAGWINYHVGRIDRRNEFAEPLGEFTSDDNAFLFGAGGSISLPVGTPSAIGLGVAGRYVSSAIDNRSADGLGFDAGVCLTFGRLSLGGAMKNIGLALDWDTDSRRKDAVPRGYHAGASYDFSVINNRVLYGLKVLGEGWKTGDGNFRFLGGFEGRLVIPNPRTSLYLRAGYGNDVWTGGLSIELNVDKNTVVGLDYGASQDYLSQSLLHHIGLHFIL